MYTPPDSLCLFALFSKELSNLTFPPLFHFLLILVPFLIFFKSKAKAGSFQLHHSEDDLKATDKLFLLKVGCLWSVTSAEALGNSLGSNCSLDRCCSPPVTPVTAGDREICGRFLTKVRVMDVGKNN